MTKKIIKMPEEQTSDKKGVNLKDVANTISENREAIETVAGLASTFLGKRKSGKSSGNSGLSILSSLLDLVGKSNSKQQHNKANSSDKD